MPIFLPRSTQTNRCLRTTISTEECVCYYQAESPFTQVTVSGTRISPMVVRLRYNVSSTDLGCAGTRGRPNGCGSSSEYQPLYSATHLLRIVLVLTSGMMLRLLGATFTIDSRDSVAADACCCLGTTLL
eukprot:3941974-Rhodomonas_salina.4